MTKEAIKELLTKKGYKVEETVVSKNGHDIAAFVIGEGLVRPTIYPDSYSNCDEENADSLMEVLVNAIDEAIENAPVDAAKLLKDIEYVKNNVFLCLGQDENDEVLTRKFLDLKQYLRVNLNKKSASAKITKSLFETYNISEDELFKIAFENTKKERTIEDLGLVMANMTMGMNVDAEVDFENDDKPFTIVVSNSKKSYGSANIIDNMVLKKLSDLYDSDIAIIPSSVHECLIMPYDENNYERLNNTVKDVNATLKEEEILSNHIYIYKRDEDEIIW